MAMAFTLTSIVSEGMEISKNPKLVPDSLRKHSITPPTSDRQARTSFASFREDRKAVAQSFIDSKFSSFTNASEETIDDSASQQGQDIERGFCSADSFNMSITNPHSMLHNLICPCNGFRGWKQISVSGKTASKSFGDLRILSRGFTWDTATKTRYQTKKSRYPAGDSPFERLPMELLGKSPHTIVVAYESSSY
jgi:hypothetical protein